MGLCTMKTFHSFTEYLIEKVQWQRSLFDHLFYESEALIAADQFGDPSYDENDDKDINSKGFTTERTQYIFQKKGDRAFHIPLNARLFERYTSAIKITAAHSTGVKGLENLAKIQKRRTKQISTYTVDNFGTLVDGIWSDNGGGVIAIVKGQAVGGLDQDIMSKVDKQGKRVLDIGNGAVTPEAVFRGDSYSIQTVSALLFALRQMKDKLVDELRNKYESKREPAKSKGEEKYATLRKHDIPGAVKQQYIKKYLDEMEKIITSKDEWKSIFVEYVLRWPARVAKKNVKKKEKSIDYDEIVVSDFEIVYCFMTDDAINDVKKIGKTLHEWKSQFKFPIKVLDYDELEKDTRIISRYLREIKKK